MYVVYCNTANGWAVFALNGEGWREITLNPGDINSSAWLVPNLDCAVTLR